MKVRLILSTATILLLFRTSFSLDGTVINSLKQKESALRNLALYAENNEEVTCADDINEILYYLKIGHEDIERTDANDIVIVVGSSGVGKSTLTQFIANETNALRAECGQWGDCWIIDDTGTIGEDLISKTFLPNLVLHESTQTPFYDMPGFNDNRNESIEIANAFFMQQILEEAESVKILVLARYSSFQISAKNDFTTLLKNLVGLIKSPAKFRGGMGIFSTMAPYETQHNNIVGRNTQFLQESLLRNISEIFVGQEEYIRGSIEILENWLVSDTGNYFDANYYSYFLTPIRGGPLLDDPLLVENKKFLDEVIWERLRFVPTEAGDFGLPMSAAALRQLEKTGSCVSQLLATQMRKFAVDLADYMASKLLNVIDGNVVDVSHTVELWMNLTTSDFSFENMSGQPLSNYLLKLLSEVENLQTLLLEETQQQIEDTLRVIQFIELTDAEIDFDPILWVINIKDVEPNLTETFKTSGLSTSNLLASRMQIFAEDLEDYILNQLSNFIDRNKTDISHISSELLTNLTTSDFSFDNMQGEPLSNYIKKLLHEVSNLKTPSLEDTTQKIADTLRVIQFIELTDVQIAFNPVLWVYDLQKTEPNLIVEFETLGTSISHLLAMQIFAVEVEDYIRGELLKVIDRNPQANIPHISVLLTNLTTSDFSFDNMQGEPLSNYLRKLLREVSKLETSSLDATKQQIEDALVVLEFIEITNVKMDFTTIRWVYDLQNIKPNLIIDFDSHAEALQTDAISSLTKESEVIAEILFAEIESLNDISEKRDLVSFELIRVKSMFEMLFLEQLKPMKKLTEFLRLYLSEYDQLRDCDRCSSVPAFDVLGVLEILDHFYWSSKDWISASVAKLQEPLEIEKDLTIFLRALFNDLSLPIVQSGENSPIYNWWSNQGQLTKENFDGFFDNIKIPGLGFSSPDTFPVSRIEEFVFYTTKGRNRVEFLLSMMLANVYNCSNSNELIVSGPIISFDRIARCINKEQTTSIVLLATSKIYANADIIGRDINSDNNINVILMSPEIIVTRNSEINLSGSEQGKPAGTQYSLFERIYTIDGSTSHQITFPNVTGGSGIDGAVGRTGEAGQRNGANNFDSSSDDCAAWSGQLQIRNYINDCNPIPANGARCSAGRIITISGTSGATGGSGGRGGDGSCGGAGGQSYTVDANVFLLPKTVTDGLQGRSGVGGPGGMGGPGGLNGRTIVTYIDTIFYLFYGYYCNEHNRMYEPATRAPTGNTGAVGQSCTSTVPRKSVNRTAVTNHFTSYKADLSSLERNEFLSLQATSLRKLINTGSPFD